MREAIRYLLVGVVASWVTSIWLRGRIVRLRGCLPYVVFGISGALAGGYLVASFASQVAAVVASVVGAITFLVVMQYLRNA